MAAVLYTLLAGEAINVDVRYSPYLTIITGAGCIATYSRVDSRDATAHKTGTENGTTVAANTRATIDTDWPYFRVSASGGTCRVVGG